MVALFISQKIGEDQKKGLRCKTSWFSVRKYVMTPPPKKKKVFAYQSLGFRVSKEKQKQMVSPQNGDTRGGPPPPPLATPLGMAPPFVTWAEGLSSKTVGEDLFFGLHRFFGRKTDLVLGWKILVLVFIILNILKFSALLPAFENPAYATAQQCCHLRSNFLGIGIYYLNLKVFLL